uniref:Uncharacterized protein n=1 Tax=Calidris pygmaea TaxID=425635 RepID=A0A8C3KKA9_9CHAR
MEVIQDAVGGPQLLLWGAGVITLLMTVVALCFLPSLRDYWRQWWVMKPIPGVSPCLPVLGNALLLERDGQGKGSSCRSPAARGGASPVPRCCWPFGHLGTLMAHIQLAVDQHPQILFCQAALWPLVPKPVALRGLVVSQESERLGHGRW